MLARIVLIAAAASTSVAAIAAEPAKPPQQPQHARPAQPQIVLASADDVRMPAAADPQSSAAPKRPRIARVTSCRCGDPQPAPQQ